MMLELTKMSGSETISKEKKTKLVKVRVTVTKGDAKKLGRVTRWEKDSRSTSLALTGRD